MTIVTLRGPSHSRKGTSNRSLNDNCCGLEALPRFSTCVFRLVGNFIGQLRFWEFLLLLSKRRPPFYRNEAWKVVIERVMINDVMPVTIVFYIGAHGMDLLRPIVIPMKTTQRPLPRIGTPCWGLGGSSSTWRWYSGTAAGGNGHKMTNTKRLDSASVLWILNYYIYIYNYYIYIYI